MKFSMRPKLFAHFLSKMPNIRGGKGYKKFKKGNDDEEIVFIEREADQYVGCILRLVGSLNASVFCEDNKTRICKIAEGIKKKVRFFVGDVVLLSYRDDLISRHDLQQGLHSDRGDILGKFSPEQYSQLKSKGVNPHVFRHIDTLSSMANSFAKGEDKKAEAIAAASNDDDLFEDGEEEDEQEHLTKPKIAWKELRASGAKDDSGALDSAGLSAPTVKKTSKENEEIDFDEL